MRFYDRKAEIERLQAIGELSETVAQFTMIMGRRRVGKTSLVLKSYEGQPLLYFFVSRKSEAELCDEYQRIIEEVLAVPVPGRITSFAVLFDFLMQLAQQRHFTLFIDEFQEFGKVNPSVFSEMQRIWDLNKANARINLIVCGSVNSLMNKIFRDRKEPLYGRQTQNMVVDRFRPSVIKEILGDYNPQFGGEDLLALYMLTGGVAKYVEDFIDNGKLTKEAMLDYALLPYSQTILEGKAMLVEEFGRDYGIYFSILSLLAEGKCTRAEIEERIGKEVGGYLTKLERDYGLITRWQPLFSETPRRVRYQLDDTFLMFWFRFIHKYGYLIESGAAHRLRDIVARDYDVFSGFVLERYFKELLIESGQYTRIGSWWDRKGEHEIDLIAIDEFAKTADFIEVKRNADRFVPAVLEEKVEVFMQANRQLRRYQITTRCLSLADV